MALERAFSHSSVLGWRFDRSRQHGTQPRTLAWSIERAAGILGLSEEGQDFAADARKIDTDCLVDVMAQDMAAFGVQSSEGDLSPNRANTHRLYDYFT